MGNRNGRGSKGRSRGRKSFKKLREIDKQAAGGDSKHHVRPTSRGGLNYMPWGRNTLVLPDDIGRGNRTIMHPQIHRVFSNKTLLEQTILMSIISSPDGALNMELFKATQTKKKLNAIKFLAMTDECRPRHVLERLVGFYGSSLAAGDVLDQLGGRSVDQFLARCLEYDDFIVNQTRTVRGTKPARSREPYEIDNREWGIIWSDDSLFEVMAFRLPALEDKNERLAERLIRRGGRQNKNQRMVAAWKNVVGDARVRPSVFAERTLRVFGRERAMRSRKRLLGERSFEELLERVSLDIRFMLGEER